MAGLSSTSQQGIQRRGSQGRISLVGHPTDVEPGLSSITLDAPHIDTHVRLSYLQATQLTVVTAGVRTLDEIKISYMPPVLSLCPVHCIISCAITAYTQSATSGSESEPCRNLRRSTLTRMVVSMTLFVTGRQTLVRFFSLFSSSYMVN